jgi:hypothetical protein
LVDLRIGIVLLMRFAFLSEAGCRKTNPLLSLPRFLFRVEVEALSPAGGGYFASLVHSPWRALPSSQQRESSAAFRRFEQR